MTLSGELRHPESLVPDEIAERIAARIHDMDLVEQLRQRRFGSIASFVP